jgi:hypothetical protein
VALLHVGRIDVRHDAVSAGFPATQSRRAGEKARLETVAGNETYSLERDLIQQSKRLWEYSEHVRIRRRRCFVRFCGVPK